MQMFSLETGRSGPLMFSTDIQIDVGSLRERVVNSVEDKAEHSLAHDGRNQTNPPYHRLSLFVQQVETCLILFLQDNVLTANSNGLFLFVYCKNLWLSSQPVYTERLYFCCVMNP